MTIDYDLDGPVAVVTIDRPEVANAIDRPTADALAGAFRRFDADPELAVAVLAGTGGKFCAARTSRRCGAATRRASAPSRPTATVRWVRRACC